MNWNKAWQWGPERTWKKYPKRGKEQAQKGATLQGYDGTRVPFSDWSSGSSAKKQEEQTTEDVMAEMKNMMADYLKSKGEEDHPLYVKLCEDHTKNDIRAQQKALNMKRKAQKKIDQIRKQLVDKEQAFTSWKQAMKQTIRQEEERHANKMKELNEELTKAIKNEEEQPDKHMSDSSSEEEQKEDDARQKEYASFLQQADQRYQVMEEANKQIHMKVDQLLAGLATITQRAREESQPSTPVEVKLATPIVTSPGLDALMSSGPKPFGKDRREKSERNGPHTPKVRDKEKAQTEQDKSQEEEPTGEKAVVSVEDLE